MIRDDWGKNEQNSFDEAEERKKMVNGRGMGGMGKKRGGVGGGGGGAVSLHMLKETSKQAHKPGQKREILQTDRQK